MGNKESLIAEFGEEGYRAKMREWGSAGGKKKVPKGFAKMDKARHLKVSTEGGFKRQA